MDKPEDKSIKIKGIIVSIVIVAVILLPICYAVYKELVMKDTAKPAAQTTVPNQEGVNQ